MGRLHDRLNQRRMIIINKIILMGRLTKDPELRHTATNKAVCSFTLAVNRKFSKEGQQQADFLPVVVWDKQAEFCGKYFKKGRQVVVVGRLQTRTWEKEDGTKAYITEIVAAESYFADSKQSGDAAEGQNQYPEIVDDDELPF